MIKSVKWFDSCHMAMRNVLIELGTLCHRPEQKRRRYPQSNTP